jgi:hypothetical protein
VSHKPYPAVGEISGPRFDRAWERFSVFGRELQIGFCTNKEHEAHEFDLRVDVRERFIDDSDVSNSSGVWDDEAGFVCDDDGLSAVSEAELAQGCG